MTSLVDVAMRIIANATLVEKSLSDHGHQFPSFDKDAAESFLDLSKEPAAQTARSSLIDDSKLLLDLLLGPADLINRLCQSPFEVAAQSLIYKYKLYDLVPLDKSTTYAELAAKTGLPEYRIRTAMRQSALNRIFDEPTPNVVVHTAASVALVKNKALQDWYGHFVEEVFPSSAKLAETMSKYPESTEPNHCSFSTAFNTPDPIFKFFDDHPDRQARFFGAMAGVGKGEGFSLRHIVTGYDWSKVGSGLVVDVGGSSGFVSMALAESYPNLKFLVQDYEHTVQGGKKALPTHLESRVDFATHDFFTPQTVSADVYFMRHICHDWAQHNAVKILKNLVPAMKPTSRIVMCELVIMPPKSMNGSQERQQRAMEMTMWTMVNAQERTREEWEEVVRLTDERLAILSINRPANSSDSLIEIGWK
ncbi:hypothetical protein TMatcc_001809 [Talaromyces marneffei ATCC 18224]|uniref:O-methyltransferase, putative n=1 Tax=Talaromyces marneffei (strain ATCC 18224 / CBS 334.59 / QM 7333) TaxID=441960 RepID=B6QHU9_TALMQ|nr:uncharacterized protein EYB26_006992 [Talaromyces marneffei]EEA22944.1 O-methyltransferase, putative [Talaromyces marneffei ATCC 18224]KAE8551824.1 hypothetical protein EYB25_005714 [Talaromyces marneffei]QGA19303.1 hypothetical protein EYB26_006992 [Talaromyces marneffei]